MRCPQCESELAPSLLACPRCQTLVHGEQLRSLADVAERAKARADNEAERAAWQAALSLLPRGSRQHADVASRLEAIDQRQVEHAPPSQGRRFSGWAGGGAVAGALLLWKLKAVVILALTKGKLLLLGLGKSSTLMSMAASFGVYWAAYGWRFGAGLVGSIYVHEMGHVAALVRYGIPATAPMFIPGLGAFVRSGRRPGSAGEQARIGLAGPVWGTAAALGALVVYHLTGSAIWALIAHFGAWINLFNLLPVWQLDGAHAFAAMSRFERAMGATVFAIAYMSTREGLLVLLALVAAFRAFGAEAPSQGDRGVLALYVGLAATLVWVCAVAPPLFVR